ncbi:hypothetical protein [Streptomyces mesophilus]|uniref:hypothetical protein n=1 Tax=Streptomyces mesophilus TaxID=1775132 RepID=UPI001F1F840B|nr:hypothetical protein [Streptomyces mesophilus]
MPKVREHIRAGVKVREHNRWGWGAHREMAIFLGIVAVVFVGSTAAGSSDGGTTQNPRPGNTGQYPVKFQDADQKRPLPKSTVSYPIPWNRG